MLVSRITTGTGDTPVVAAVFGLGLIGSAVAERLSGPGTTPRTVPIHWDDHDAQVHQLGDVEREIVRFLEWRSDHPGSSGSRRRLHLLWSAGKAGFSADEKALGLELEAFQRVLDLAERLAPKLAPGHTSFGLISSAGGLFEGQRNVTARSKPSPGRPYGRSKLAQENLLAARSAIMDCRVYRLSSVYGYVRPGKRTGLVGALVANALAGRVTLVDGRLDTLRDFVWVEDVADRLVRGALAGSDTRESRGIETLAAGKPSSILEIKRHVEAALGRRVYVSYSARRSNQKDITFSRGALPRDWTPSDLETNVRKVCFDAVGTPRTRPPVRQPVPG